MNKKIKVFGDGSEENPYSSDDKTAGIQTSLDELTHGGCVSLSSSRYNIEKTITIDSCSSGLKGDI